jgi:hypothetical protein
LKERLAARAVLKDAVIRFRHIGIAAAAGRFDEAEMEYRGYLKLFVGALPMAMAAAQQWSLFNPAVHRAHYAALWQRLRQTQKPTELSAARANATTENTAK